MHHFAESVDNDQNGVQLAPCPGQTQDEIEADFLPRRLGYGKGQVLTGILLGQFADRAGGAAADHPPNVTT